MEELNDRDRQVVIMRYGLADNEPKTLGEVAELLGLSRERVRQIEERAVNTLRREAQKAGILEVTTHDLRTRKLHSAMRPRFKTNILGETVDKSPLARLLKKRAAMAAASKSKKTSKPRANQMSRPVKKSASKKEKAVAVKKKITKHPSNKPIAKGLKTIKKSKKPTSKTASKSSRK